MQAGLLHAPATSSSPSSLPSLITSGTAALQDWHYWGNLGWGPQWDPNVYPDPAAMVQNLSAAHLKLMVCRPCCSAAVTTTSLTTSSTSTSATSATSATSTSAPATSASSATVR